MRQGLPGKFVRLNIRAIEVEEYSVCCSVRKDYTQNSYAAQVAVSYRYCFLHNVPELLSRDTLTLSERSADDQGGKNDTTEIQSLTHLMCVACFWA